jgi:hypothetical protein
MAEWKMDGRAITDSMVDGAMQWEKRNKEPLDLAIEGFRV